MNEIAEGEGDRPGVSELCARVGMSRQNYYAARRLRQRRQIDEALILELVRRERRMQPRLGGRKLLHLLREDFDEAGVSIGRDRFFELLAESTAGGAPQAGSAAHDQQPSQSAGVWQSSGGQGVERRTKRG